MARRGKCLKRFALKACRSSISGRISGSVAPSAYNDDDPVGELPGSPLDPSPAPSGFRRAA